MILAILPEKDSLAPLDLADIDTFLDHLPQWTHIPQPRDNFYYSVDYKVDLGFGGESSNTESEGRVSHIFGRT
jgi:hypothetical protein